MVNIRITPKVDHRAVFAFPFVGTTANLGKLNSSNLPILTVIPAKAGPQQRIDTMDSRCRFSPGQVYACKSRVEEDKLRYGLVESRFTAIFDWKSVNLS